MSKRIILITLISTIFYGLTIGDLSGSNEELGINNNKELQANKLNYIESRFCNKGLDKDSLSMDLSLITKAGTEKEICIIFFNEHKENIKVWGKFPDNAIEPNGNRNCSTNYGRDNPFSKFIKPTEDIIEIPAMGNKVIKTTVKFPVGIEGMQKGCFAYGIVGAENVGGMFTFVTRKIRYINVLVEGNGDIKNKIEVLNVKNNLDKNKNFGISFDVQNKSSTDQSLDIKGKIFSILGYKKDFSISGIVVGLDKNININTNDFETNFNIPRYKGPFKIEITAKHKPHFDFDISNSGIDPNFLKEQTITKTKSIFIFPTLPVIGLLVLIILVYFAFFKKTKVVYIQAPQTTPPLQQ